MTLNTNNILEFKTNRYIMKEYSNPLVGGEMITLTHVEVLDDPTEDLVLDTLRSPISECPWSILGIFTSDFLYSSLSSENKFIYLEKHLSNIVDEMDLHYLFNNPDIQYFMEQPNFDIIQSKVQFALLSTYFLYMGSMTLEETLKTDYQNGDY